MFAPKITAVLFVTVSTSLIVTSAASAHVVLEKREAAAGTYYKAVFQVGHGCDGSPTTRLRITIPDGVIAIKPMQKPGWILETVKADYGRSFTQHGREITTGVREVTWRGGPLADDNYDEFVLMAYLTDTLTPGTIYFPAVQECEKGISHWTEIPVTGQPRPAMPAPALAITKGEHAHHH